jgi:DNA mismatch repair protein MutS
LEKTCKVYLWKRPARSTFGKDLQGLPLEKTCKVYLWKRPARSTFGKDLRFCPYSYIMYEEYGKAYATYRAKYGQKTAIFLMVGAFYELYDIQDRSTGETAFNVREVTDFLGIAVTVKRDLPPKLKVWEATASPEPKVWEKDLPPKLKVWEATASPEPKVWEKDLPPKEHANSIGLFAGFPDYTLHKHAARLTSNGWTVIVIDQVKDGAGKVVRRQVARILSPSTHVEAMGATETPYLTTLLFVGGHVGSAYSPTFGLATLDLTTGSTLTYCGQAVGYGDVWTADDLQQQLTLYQPKELLIFCKGVSLEESHVRRLFSIPLSTPVHIRPILALQQGNHDEYFRKTYSIQSMLPPKEYLSLRSDLEEQALLLLLQFTEEHMPSAMKSFQRNQPWVPNQSLVCGNHALQQLQMDSVVSLFNTCITPMGKRDIKHRLMKPLTQASMIRNRLEEVAEFLEWPTPSTKTLESYLRFMGDIPRLHRKCQLGTLLNQDFVTLGQTYDAIKNIIKECFATSTCFVIYPGLSERLATYQEVFQKHINMEKALKGTEDTTPFESTAFTEIGELEAQIQTVLEKFESLRAELCSTASLSVDAIRLEAREKEPFGLKASSSTLKALQGIELRLPKGLVIQNLKSGGWIDTPILSSLNQTLLQLRERLGRASRTATLETCLALSTAGQSLWLDLETWVSHVDCTQAIARASRERGFHPPTIDEEEGDSYVDLKGLRHPLVESTGTRIGYVQHSVELRTNSWLIYGMNASGKSTLMKAVGIATILAQAGCYVPAASFTLRPFKSIYTRILNQDNLFAGLSSFAVEMSELRDILRSADERTLVLGDELCSGTESVSAAALVASGIEWLSKKRAKFIFATHLHGLPTLLDCEALRLKVWHLHVEYDPVSHKLVYDRTLMPGSGSTLYGLEVARAMDLPLEFLEQAKAYRHRLAGSVMEAEAKPSAWNAAIKRRACEVCGNPVTANLEVHHLDPRANTVHGILPNGTPMNAAANLIVLCEACHLKEHAVQTLQPLVQTSVGPERASSVTTATSAKTKRSKWSEEELRIVEEMLTKYKGTSLKALSYQLKSQHQMDISVQSLTAIRKGLV